MPHKHTRRGNNPADFDLPPTQIAKALPVIPPPVQENQNKQSKINSTPKGNSHPNISKRKREASSRNDDTPRAFKRLMAFSKGKTRRSGLDDAGSTATSGTRTKTPNRTPSVPEIQPGESLWDYSARVDAALPVSGLVAKTTKNGRDPLGMKAYQTRKEKKMHKLYDQWRAEDKKMKEKREEALEMEAEKALEDSALIPSSGLVFDGDKEAAGHGRKNRKRKRTPHHHKEDDPWEELRRKRGENRPKLGNVATAPPTLGKVNPKLPMRT